MDFEALLKQIKENLLLLSSGSYSSLNKQLKKDIETFIKASKEKLERWVLLLAAHQITEEEFEWLVKSQKEILTLQELYATGTSKIALGHLKNKILKVIVDAVKIAVLAKK